MGVRRYVVMHLAVLQLLILSNRCILEAHRRLLPASAAYGGGLTESLGDGPARRTTPPILLIYPSDRGSQHCSFSCIQRLRQAGIAIRMTQQGDPYEDAVAERVNGILKTDSG